MKVIDLYDDSTFATSSDDYQFEVYMNKIEYLYHLTASKNENHVIQVYELGVDSQEEYAGYGKRNDTCVKLFFVEN